LTGVGLNLSPYPAIAGVTMGKGTSDLASALLSICASVGGSTGGKARNRSYILLNW